MKIRIALLSIVAFAVWGQPSFAALKKVDVNATGANNGNSWTDAYTSLQTALEFAYENSGPDVIWVAQGTYVPGSSVSSTFALPANTLIYGGFAGGEDDVLERNWVTHPTILSGVISGNNTYHVVTSTASGAVPVLNGFIIEGGDADAGSDTKGGGIKASIGAFVNCTIRNNEAVVTCSPKSEPVLMRVPMSPGRASETLDDETDTTLGRADHRQVA